MKDAEQLFLNNKREQQHLILDVCSVSRLGAALSRGNAQGVFFPARLSIHQGGRGAAGLVPLL